MPVKKVEISERESIQEFSRESKRQILEEACLVFEGQLHLHHHNWFFFWCLAKTGFLHSSCRPRPRSLWPGQTSWWNTIRENYRVSLVQNVYDILVVLLVEEYFSRSTIHDQAFFFFVFLKKIHSHSPCQFAEGPPARRQDPKSTLVALTAAPLILPFFQVQDKTSRDSSFVFATCKVCCKLELRRYLSSSTAGRAQCQASRGRSLQYKDRTTSRAL